MASHTGDWDVATMLEWATSLFRSKDVAQPRLSIEWILAHALEIRRFDVYLQFERPLTKPELEKIRGLVQRRLKHEPIQYLMGNTDFFGCHILVNPSVLIPRPETEELVELVLNAEPDELRSVLDIGTGSGCIPIALKKKRANWNVYGMDISSDALETAKKNAAVNETDISFFKMDVRKAAARKPENLLDVIVSNPPYITKSEQASMDRDVLLWEPELALFCSEPLEFYTAILETAKTWLKPGGRVYLELNPDFSEPTKAAFQQSGFDAEIRNDLSGKQRFLNAVKKTGSF